MGKVGLYTKILCILAESQNFSYVMSLEYNFSIYFLDMAFISDWTRPGRRSEVGPRSWSPSSTSTTRRPCSRGPTCSTGTSSYSSDMILDLILILGRGAIDSCARPEFDGVKYDRHSEETCSSSKIKINRIENVKNRTLSWQSALNVTLMGLCMSCLQ